ncbi:oxoglutarate-dependent flavonoid 7-O-demethylase 1-like [Arachis stenosperma]|uniref:oxoglutarate-dependent flavonoid 7-O-demethylase 1-like n=1 Tax=Arachis stenosperma TaxID=217475 RepID=UPI0025AD285F|nr:oxoglutarate-dependent flavonoid 7-O-demethylase 1-like [Arachis stenosperma]
MEAASGLVPSVQEIAKEALAQVPHRYVRHQHDRPIFTTSTNPHDLPQVPVIDMAKLLSQHHREPELQKLHYACKDWGFFQLINHGVDTSLLENVKKGAQDFFNQPVEEKRRFGQIDGDVQGYGQAFVVSDEQKLDWADMFFMFTLPHQIRKPHLFPKIPLPFRDYLEDYCGEMEKLAVKMLGLMADDLSIHPMEIRDMLGEAEQSLRMNYYPPCPQPELAMGLSSHSDGGGLTILLQANQVEGLQIKKDGLWIPVRPLPNAFIINIGDMLEIITNGIYSSVEHRATVNSEKERLSIATFYNPALDAIIGPAPSLVTPETPAAFKRIAAGEYFKGYLSQELRGKSFLDSIRIPTGK